MALALSAVSHRSVPNYLVNPPGQAAGGQHLSDVLLHAYRLNLPLAPVLRAQAAIKKIAIWRYCQDRLQPPGKSTDKLFQAPDLRFQNTFWSFFSDVFEGREGV